MNRYLRGAGAASLALLTLAACTSAGTAGAARPTGAAPPAAAPFTAADLTFATAMSMHLSQASTLAQIVGTRLDDPTVRRLQGEIRGQDDATVDAIAQWLHDWAARGVELPHVAELGDATPAGLVPQRQVDSLRRTVTARGFLTLLRAHHRAGLPLIDAELRAGVDPRARELAQRLRARYTTDLQQIAYALTTPAGRTERPGVPR